MLYLATASGPLVTEAISGGRLGYLHQPASNALQPGWTWAADNGCFSDQWDAGRWWAFLERHADRAASCLFAVCPDVVGDAQATDRLWAAWAPRIKALGYPVAYVGQDGASAASVPWAAMDAWFTGGTTGWKLSPEAQRLARRARAAGKWTHMGRVNSMRRLRFAYAHGYDSVDGTFLAFGPDVNLPRLLRALAHAHHPVLFDGL